MIARIIRRAFSMLAILACGWAHAELPDGLVWDDGYAWFDVSEKGTLVNGQPQDQGWQLQYAVRIFGNTPERSAFRMVLSRDGEELGSYRVEGQQKYPGRPGFDWDRSLRSLHQDSLGDWKQRFIGDGFYDLDVYYIDGSDLKAHLARSYTLDVRKVHRVRGLANKAVTDAPHYYINRHGDSAWSFVHQRPQKFPGYLGSGGMRNAVVLYWHAAPREGKHKGQSVSQQLGNRGRLRVKVDGKPLNLGTAARHQNVVNKQVRQVYAVHTDRNAEQYRTGPEYEEPIRFVTYETVLPLTWRDDTGELLTRQASGSITYEAEPRPELVALNDHPGTWELDWVAGGETIRSWKFDVDDKGRIAAWDEAPEEVTLHPFAQIVEMDIPVGGASVDGRLTAKFVEDGALFGLGLPDEFSDKVPEKGKPFPALSTAATRTP